MNLVFRYYAFLQRRCLQSSRYSSLSELKLQLLPWFAATIALTATATWILPAGSTASDALWMLALAVCFGGIAFVAIAFFQAAMDRPADDDSSAGPQ